MGEKPENIWNDEQAWTSARYSSAYANYLKATLPPAEAKASDVVQVKENLWNTPIVKVILSHQAPDGSWPLGAPPWSRMYPFPLLVLLEYSMIDHPATQKGVKHLHSTIEGEKFLWPRHESYDPKDYYIAHQGRCLQVMAKAGLASDSRVQTVANGLLHRQHEDGGWSRKPDWLYKPGETKSEPRPSCWICTLEVMSGLGQVLSLPGEAVERTLNFWNTHLNPENIFAMLACLDFSANQGLKEHHPFVARLLASLDKSLGAKPHFAKYFNVMATYLKRRLSDEKNPLG